MKNIIFTKQMIWKNNHPTAVFISYVFFAGLATIVDIGLLWFLTDRLGIHYMVSAFFSYLAGMFTNYFFNKYLTFNNRSRQYIKQFGLFSFVALVGLALNQLIIWSLVEYFHFWYITAKLISVFIVMFWSFFGHKKITFGIIKE